MKTYFGKHRNGHAEVYVSSPESETYFLPRGLEFVNHSPDGFEWGYGGSGPSQLAFAIMHDYFKGQGLTPKEAYEKLIRGLYQEFKWEFVANWKDEWQLTEDNITEWLKGRG